jgi:tetratricopeptide (TPR) repeat protein
MADEKTFQEAIQAIKDGDHEKARELLTGLIKKDQNNPEYWLWLSTIVESPSERNFCLESVLKLDPDNKSALRGLMIAGARPATEEIKPVPPVRRKWTLEDVPAEPKTWVGKILVNPILRVASILIVLAIVAGLVTAGVMGFRYTQQVAIMMVSITPRPTLSPTISPTPTSTPTRVARTPTSTFQGPQPLWTLLEATYTPTPRYVDTPHPVLEAYRSGMRSFERGNLEQMLQFMQQASRDDPLAADIWFYIGEANRRLGKYEEASQAFLKASEVNPNFAPPYAGYAQTLQALDVEKFRETILENFDKAIELDPNYIEGFLGRAHFYLANNQLEEARADIDSLAEINTQDPRLYLLLARINIAEGDYDSALENAKQAYAIDITLPDVYYVLAEAYVQEGNFEEALEKIQIYLPFDEENIRAKYILGQALYETDDEEAALEAFDEVLRLDNRYADAYWYRGQIFLNNGEGQQAVNEFYTASLIVPQSFIVNLDLGRALWVAERIDDALQQLNVTEDLAETDAQLAEVLYWRGQVLEAGQNPRAALQAYTELLAFPEESIPLKFRQFAQERLLVLNPPTVTPTVTLTVTLTPTKTLTASPTSTQTKTATSTQRPTATPTATRTPTVSRTATRTSTP